MFRTGPELALEPLWNGGLVYVAERAEVVLGNPVPQFQLSVCHYCCFVKKFHYGFRVEIARLVAVQRRNECRISLFVAQRYGHTASGKNFPLELLRNTVCECTRQWQWQYDFGKLFHSKCEGIKKLPIDKVYSLQGHIFVIQ